ncbi:AbrB family transcriptional regulator [Sneathiella aquimaris]|uniref:AbrB family transcriptional regulator n=1 Tax=Sneathiella aquimaris TaxID=2599305 RepID=UPI00146C54EC|nr:AbrB family transcriptional regulator [Sneathiella aquimaris]
MTQEILLKTLKSLAFGTIGGGVFFYFDLPLAWMMGSMCLLTVLSVKGVDLAVYPPLRQVMTSVLGVMLGSSFSPDTLNNLMVWGNGLVILMLSVVLSMTAAYFYFRTVGGFDRTTAYFSSAPGGFNVMYEVGEAKGGDGRKIALIHATRVLLLVMTVPLVFRYGVQTHGQTTELPLFGTLEDLPGYGWLLVAAIVGYVAGKKLKFPAYHLMGPLLVAALFEMSGFITAKPPMVLVYLAQLVIGSAIGLRFLGTSVSQIRNIILLSIGSTGIMMIIATTLAFLATSFTGISVAGLVLALSPGGLAEMSLVALALGIDVAFVSIMHVIRIAVIIAVIPVLYPLFKKIAGN